VLEKKIKSRTLYSKKPISIPWPEFYVLYNGTEPFPDNDTLRLSDLFKKPQELGLPKKIYPLLELEVKVININEGRNSEIVNRCKKLSDYSTFIARIHTFWKEADSLEEAVKKAIIYCQNHDILKEFLEIHASGVLNMILTEWNTEDAITFAREEGREEGYVQGEAKGEQKILDLLKSGKTPEEIIRDYGSK
jgi:hypothetical protein